MTITITQSELIGEFRSTGQPVFLMSPDGEVIRRFEPIKGKVSIPESGKTDDELDAIFTDPNTVWVPAEVVMERLREIDRAAG